MIITTRPTAKATATADPSLKFLDSHPPLKLGENEITAATAYRAKKRNATESVVVA